MAPSSVNLLATSCLLALLFSVATCKHEATAAVGGAAATAPTKAQLKAEIDKMGKNITKYAPQYADIVRYISLLFSTKVDVSALKDATLLIPNNTNTKALIKRVPANSKNVPRLYNVTAYHALIKKTAITALKKMRPGQTIKTALKSLIAKQGPANGAIVSFGRPGSAAATWTTIRSPRLYVGPYFVAHGVDKVLTPPGTVL